ncbi:MAG: sensor histidine kinase [Pegethrix bostrychoides GSE-TBD4-15B]|jgi:signal transduction histidine kinase|uniref:Sensor histidine kinase n=1 Tax=Pegethrix bostrychoides GSE-TBD4-15B TaxID=2839662 RepID=A0A951PCN7_9CYAN|nr:sensor histidine kinase [Pegethrix bostrychoides GSE-TBD4-15B]
MSFSPLADSDPSHPRLPVPYLPDSSPSLSLESVLSDLPLYDFQIEAHHTGIEVARIFEQCPTLPGVVLMQNGTFLGLLSRQRLLEFLIRPRGLTLFLPSSLSVLYSYARVNHLILPALTSVLAAAPLALRRSADQQSEPVVVALADQTYRLLDIHDLNIAHWQLRGIETQVRYERMQTQMIQTEKMASLGRLVDGVAHEILDPVGFIWGNLSHLSDYSQQMLLVLAAYEQHFPDLPPTLADLQQEVELEYLRADLPQTILSIRAGAERLKTLVTSLQNFCHSDDVYPKPANLHESLDGILLLLKSRLKGEIQVVKRYGHLPPVRCYAGQLNQVLINILTNAIDALLDQSVRQNIAAEFYARQPHLQSLALARPQITITTEVRPDAQDRGSRWVVVWIADNGPGMSADQLQQVLESFSVQRRADKETSLALSYRIVTAKHGGKFYIRSSPAESPDLKTPDLKTPDPETPDPAPSCAISGTEFELWLPLT